MMITRDRILHVLLDAIAQFNEELALGELLVPSEETSLVPGSSGLDSLAFINLVTLFESLLENQMGLSLSLAEEARTAGDDPWRSVGALADFVVSRARQGS
jgi:acyl carrier protein